MKGQRRSADAATAAAKRASSAVVEALRLSRNLATRVAPLSDAEVVSRVQVHASGQHSAAAVLAGLALAIEDGRLRREPGGFWVAPLPPDKTRGRSGRW